MALLRKEIGESRLGGGTIPSMLLLRKKRRLYKAWKRGERKQENLTAKHTAKKTVHATKKRKEVIKFASVEKDNKSIFRIVKQMKKENKDCCGRVLREEQPGADLTH